MHEQIAFLPRKAFFYHEKHERRERFFTTKNTKGAKDFLPRKTRKARKAFNESSWVCKSNVSFNLIKAFKKRKSFSCIFVVFVVNNLKTRKTRKTRKSITNQVGSIRLKKNFSCVFVVFVVNNLKAQILNLSTSKSTCYFRWLVLGKARQALRLVNTHVFLSARTLCALSMQGLCVCDDKKRRHNIKKEKPCRTSQ
jgi:hypothetical protein